MQQKDRIKEAGRERKNSRETERERRREKQRQTDIDGKKSRTEYKWNR